LPPETKPQPAALAVPPVPAGPPAPAPADTAALVKKRVAQAGRDFMRQSIELIGNEQRGFHLKLCITMAYIWLKIGEKDAYVDDLLAKLNDQHKGEWVPAKTTLQHYEGPMLRWLAKLARQKNPNDPSLPTKFTITFLREHPRHILDIGDADLKALNKDCKTLLELDKKHGNDCVKPQVLPVELPAKAMAPAAMTPAAEAIAISPPKKIRNGAKHELPARAIAPAVKATPTEDTVTRSPQKNAGRTKRKPAQHAPLENRPRQSTLTLDIEGTLLSNDEMLESIQVIKQNMLGMEQAGVPVERDVCLALFQCYMTAKKINKYFTEHTFPLAV